MKLAEDNKVEVRKLSLYPCANIEWMSIHENISAGKRHPCGVLKICLPHIHVKQLGLAKWDSDRHRWSHWHKVRLLDLANYLREASQWLTVPDGSKGNHQLAGDRASFLECLAVNIYKKSIIKRVSEIPKEVNMLSDKPGDLNWIWRTHRVPHIYIHTLISEKERRKW